MRRSIGLLLGLFLAAPLGANDALTAFRISSVTAVVFFPQPWRLAGWFKHFVAYCRGAAWNEREAK